MDAFHGAQPVLLTGGQGAMETQGDRARQFGGFGWRTVAGSRESKKPTGSHRGATPPGHRHPRANNFRIKGLGMSRTLALSE